MRLRTALACTAFLVLLFTIAVWSTPLEDNKDSEGLEPSNPRSPR